ncbi:GNAT family N-acetyltransferase [Halosegnis marinus]|uniref:GNAT family N-acetyltransferase n=1 Tax=Halosegnis marinus TaxID=3034023 RepID=A0ABD5ZQM9_9EURY|nr:GNAT family N-acetyltransferase [Halosegnis sp. DT85]
MTTDGGDDLSALGPFRDAADRRVELRPCAGPDDRAPLAALYGCFDAASRAGGVPPAAPPALDRWLDVVLRFPSVVAWHGTDAVGQVFLAPDGDGHELSVFIDPAYHHAGVGGRLVDAALALAAARGGGRVGVLTRGDNRPMLALALAHGFVVTGTADGQVELARDVPAAE